MCLKNWSEHSAAMLQTNKEEKKNTPTLLAASTLACSEDSNVHILYIIYYHSADICPNVNGLIGSNIDNCGLPGHYWNQIGSHVPGSDFMVTLVPLC